MSALLKALLCACLASLQVSAKLETKDLVMTWSVGLDTSKVVYAVNCGSDLPLTDDIGVVYSADTDFEGG